MSYRVHIHPEAAAEFYDSILWYETQLPGLGMRFESKVLSTMRVLAARPESGGYILETFRQLTVDGFPFVVVYRISTSNNDVYVSSVFNTHRNAEAKFRE